MQKLNPEWDVVVIGAGPAGSTASYLMKKKGFSVLLIDRSEFPRTKVCGSCINLRALKLLESIGLKQVIDQHHPPSINKFHFGMNQQQFEFPLPGGRALSRERFDYSLIEEAQKIGVVFSSKTLGSVGEFKDSYRNVLISRNGTEEAVKAKIILVADGLAGNALEKKEGLAKVDSHSRMGISTILVDAPNFYQPETIYMAYSPFGYVGLVRLEDGRLDIAAAIDPEHLKQGISKAVRTILQLAGFQDILNLDDYAWKGTPLLTQAREHAAGERFFVLGDAAGYTEPFTGEGISWALESAIRVIPFAERGIHSWNLELMNEWNLHHQKFKLKKQQLSKWVMKSLRNSHVTHVFAQTARYFPFLAKPLIKQVCLS